MPPNFVNQENTKSHRLLSLDALRGFDMFWIISGEGIFHGLAKATALPVFVFISSQLHHSDWNGFTFYDLIFPLFIFISGCTMPFSIGKEIERSINFTAEDTEGRREQSTRRLAPWFSVSSVVKIWREIQPDRIRIYKSLLTRTIILLFLGMLVNGLLQWKAYEQTRFASVLGRIALSGLGAALIYINTSRRGLITWLAGLLIGYWLIMTLIPVPGYGAGVLTPEGSFASYFDRLFLPGKLHKTVYDPEGLLSTIPAIASALLGVLAGQLLRHPAEKISGIQKTLILLFSGILLVLIGDLWGIVFPVNKRLWTSSFVLVAGGYSAILVAGFYFLIDVMSVRKWSLPFVWIGTNSILIYVAAHGAIDFLASSSFFFGGLINKTPLHWHETLLWTGVALIQFTFLYFLYHKNWFLKV